MNVFFSAELKIMYFVVNHRVDGPHWKNSTSEWTIPLCAFLD